ASTCGSKRTAISDGRNSPARSPTYTTARDRQVVTAAPTLPPITPKLVRRRRCQTELMIDERPFVADRLAAPFGVVSAVVPLPGLRGLPRLAGYQAQIGSGVPGAGYSGKPVAGYGSDASSEAAGQRIAIAEALERYSAGDFLREDRVWARASELDGEVLDLGSVARCSEREYSDPRCPFVPPDPDAEKIGRASCR